MSFLLVRPLAVTFLTEGWGHPRVGRLHGGLDLRAKVGTECFAAASGTVRFVGGYKDTVGINVEIEHGGGMATRYLHLSRVDVAKGWAVVAGQKIGFTGHASSPHLHFDAWLMAEQVPIYAILFGTPVGGFSQKHMVAGKIRFKVPSEPLVPIDGMQADVAAMVERFGIRVRSGVDGGESGGGGGEGGGGGDGDGNTGKEIAKVLLFGGMIALGLSMSRK